jgi:hypothetical protein
MICLMYISYLMAQAKLLEDDFVVVVKLLIAMHIEMITQNSERAHILYLYCGRPAETTALTRK